MKSVHKHSYKIHKVEWDIFDTTALYQFRCHRCGQSRDVSQYSLIRIYKIAK